jgi:hypothetical protein
MISMARDARPASFLPHSGRFLVHREVRVPADDTNVGVSPGFPEGSVEEKPPE